MNITERIGVSKIQLIVYEKLHWIFREQQIDDCGIDAHIELKDVNYATGKLIAVQIKSGESYFINESNNDIVYYISEKHLNYWRSNVLPVIIVLYNPETDECIWEYIGRIKEKNKLCINRTHSFNESAKDELSMIANVEPYKIAQILRRKFIEKSNSLDILIEHTYMGKEPNKSVNTYQIAIDFGTTRTMIGLISEDGRKSNIIKTEDGKNYFDTIIGFDENYQYCIGDTALKRKDDSSFKIIRNFKRELGLSKEYQIFGLILSAEDITTLFLQAVINYIEIKYEISIEKCCISDPIDFSYCQKKEYEKCLKNCNLNIIRTISESTCVMLNEDICYRETAIIVIDIGGGTFDISSIETGYGIFEVLDVMGDRTVGGVDYDFALGEYIKEKLKCKYPGILIDSFLDTQIVFKAEEVKILLSTMDKVQVFFPECYCMEQENTIFCDLEISRNDFREATNSLNIKVEKILNKFKERIVEKDYFTIPKEILLGGLGSKIFTINELIHKYFPEMVITDLRSGKKVIEGLIAYSKKLKGFYGAERLLLDIMGCDIVLEGEELYDVDFEMDKEATTSKQIFKLTEKISKIVILKRDYTVPTKNSYYFGVKKSQQISILVVWGKHRDIAFTHTLNNNTVYLITVNVDNRNRMYGKIENTEEQNIVCEFKL